MRILMHGRKLARSGVFRDHHAIVAELRNFTDSAFVEERWFEDSSFLEARRFMRQSAENGTMMLALKSQAPRACQAVVSGYGL
jgi:hypothetical protein